MIFYSVFDEAFRPFGKVLTGLPVGDILDKLCTLTPCPEDGVYYVPSEPMLEQKELFGALSNQVFGTMPIQLGYCNGKNHTLNCLEYHRGSEFNLAAEDMILLLALQQDVRKDFTLDTANVKAFLVPAGTPVLVYETALHYAPVSASKDSCFHCLVGLPRGTNEPLPEAFSAAAGEAKLLRARNKWLIAHKDAPEAAQGAFVGLQGANITITYE